MKILFNLLEGLTCCRRKGQRRHFLLVPIRFAMKLLRDLSTFRRQSDKLRKHRIWCKIHCELRTNFCSLNFCVEFLNILNLSASLKKILKLDKFTNLSKEPRFHLKNHFFSEDASHLISPKERVESDQQHRAGKSAGRVRFHLLWTVFRDGGLCPDLDTFSTSFLTSTHTSNSSCEE